MTPQAGKLETIADKCKLEKNVVYSHLINASVPTIPADSIVKIWDIANGQLG
jgi:hypothetical protein